MVRRKCASALVALKVRQTADAVENDFADFHLNLTTSAGWSGDFWPNGGFRFGVHGIHIYRIFGKAYTNDVATTSQA